MGLITKQDAKPENVIVRVRGKDRLWVDRKGRLYDDGSVECDGRTYVTHRGHIDHVPTIGRKLGLTRGTKPVVMVQKEHAISLLVDEIAFCTAKDCGHEHVIPTMRHDGSAELQHFKKMKLAQQIASAASKEGSTDVLKAMLIAGLIGIGLLFILLIFIIQKLGVFVQKPATTSVGIHIADWVGQGLSLLPGIGG